ncbi:MAG: BaiN/RdsA family NAD(P)/FAD-dependent oxidoreductase [Candidatus Humimicrobiaceae bacterium]
MNNSENILDFKVKNSIYDIAVIGGGPAGIMAAISAKRQQEYIKLVIIEKNNKLGKKLLLTGNGRCNFTTSVGLDKLIDSFGKSGRFFSEAFNEFSNNDLILFFKSRGVLPEYEDGFKVFPKDGKALSVLNCLKNELHENNINVVFGFEVQCIGKYPKIEEIRSSKKEITSGVFKISSAIDRHIFAKKVILATGGLSYPQTGSTGDGYKFAKSLGHRINQFSPSIVPVVSRYISSLGLQGISLKNIDISVISDKKTITKEIGEDIIFTHFGLSGPAANSLGNIIFRETFGGKEIHCSIDLSPELSYENYIKKYEELRAINLKKEIGTLIKMILKNIPDDLLLKIFHILKIDMHQKAGNASKKDILKIIDLSKNFKFTTEGTLPITKAIITEGGIPLKEINPKTMQSRITENLYFAGEIIEMQGPEGGFNLQKAFSTGWLAGKMAGLK